MDDLTDLLPDLPDAQADDLLPEIKDFQSSYYATPQKRVGYGAVAEDIWSGVKAVPGQAWGFLKALPGELYGVQQQLTDLERPGRPLRNVASGLASGVRGLLNAPANTLDYLREREITPPWLQAARPEAINNIDYRQVFGLNEQLSGDALISGLSEFAPNLIAGGPSRAMALQAIGQNENPVTAALIPPTFKYGPKVISKLPKLVNPPLTPSGWVARFAKDNISLSELADNLRAAEGTETPLGDIVKSPRLKKYYENTLAQKAPYEVEQTYKRINEQIQSKAENLIDEKLGAGLQEGDGNILVKKALRKAYVDNRDIKNNLYNEASTQAVKEGFSPDLSRFRKIALENAEAIDSSPLLKNNAEFKKLYNRLLNLSNVEEVKTVTSPAGQIVDKSGKPLIVEGKKTLTYKPTIKDANLIANDLYDSGQQMLKSPSPADRMQGELYKKLGTILREDVQNSIDRSGSKLLQEQSNAAKQYYKDEFVQFLDRDLYSLLNESKDPQSIVRGIIKPSKRVDNYRLIEKVQKILPEDQQKLLGYTYLRGAIDKNGVLQPTEVNALIKSLGTRQFNALFADEATRQAILDFSRLRNMNTEAATYLLNPKTGARNQSWLSGMMEFLPETVGGGIGASGGGTLGAVLGITVTNLAKNASNRYLAKLLTNPNFRGKVARKIAKEKGQKKFFDETSKK